MNVINDDQAKRNIAANLHRLMATRGITQTALAEAADVSQSRISQVLRAQHMAGAGLLARIAEAFDVSIDRLVGYPPEEIPEISLKSA
jgi:transcriptional regulator with XRE-family HTH domain